MPTRSSDSHRLVRWIWTGKGIGARLARLPLVPLSLLYAAFMRLRAEWYRRGWTTVRQLPLPSVSVGNLSVGGSGKTPLAAWIANRYRAAGLRPAILLRGTGGDEPLVHAEAVPDSIVVANPDRVAGANQALAAAADVLVLDDAYQRLDTARDLNLCVISAESDRAVRWALPAGPWREGWSALDRADAVIITRKRADAASAGELASRIERLVAGPVAIAHLHLELLDGLISGTPRPLSTLSGSKVVVATAIADPAAFVSQIKAIGALVQVATWKDHHSFRDVDLAWLAHAARRADHLVITAKDAVKLRDRWPASVPEPLVARLAITFEAGEQELLEILDALPIPGSASPTLAKVH